MPTDFAFVYCTCASMEQARLIGKAIVSKRLAACANILPSMHSIYWWENELQEEIEMVLIFKTISDLVPALTEKIKELHSYSTPCVISLPIESGNQDYLNWIRNETQSFGGIAQQEHPSS